MSKPDPERPEKWRENILPVPSAEKMKNCSASLCSPFWCYFTPDGQPIPSTVRAKPGDCGSALAKTGIKYRGISPEQCQLRRIELYWENTQDNP